MTTALITATHEHWGDGPGPVFPFFFLAFWLAVIGAFFIFRRGTGPRRNGEALLAERYARGDITEDEYRLRRDVLRGKK